MPTLSPSDATDLFRAPPHDFIEVDGGAVAYRKIGTGPDVLFVHGWPVSGATFRTLLPFLADDVTCHVIDLPGGGDSRFGRDTPLTLGGHVASVRRVIDALGLDDFAVVGHDSGGMIARHAVADDPRLRAMGLLDTEQPQGLAWRFRLFLLPSVFPGFETLFGWAVGQPRLRRNPLLLGDVFYDRDRIDGEFDEFFLQPIHRDPARRWAAATFARNFDARFVRELGDVHQRIRVPVKLVWGERDPFLPLQWAEEMVDTFPDASLHVVRDASLFVHEERPQEVADALRPVLARGRVAVEA